MKKLETRSKRPQKDASPQRFTTRSRTWLLAAVVLLSGGAAWAFAEFILWNHLPADLVGKWVVVGGEQEGATFDFYRGGNMLGRINVKGLTHMIEARVDVDNGRLLATTANPNTGAKETRSQTIVRLSRTELVLRDEQGKDLRMVRADD